MKIIHVIYPVIGIMMVLALCITPVAAVSGTDFEVVVEVKEDTWNCVEYYEKYTYLNVNDPNEEYFRIFTHGSVWLCSLVTFRPANIPNAPMMAVNTDRDRFIYLPRSVDDWEIKYYSHYRSFYTQDPKYLKNAGTINLNEYFGKDVKVGLNMELGVDQKIFPLDSPEPCWYIPEVKK